MHYQVRRPLITPVMLTQVYQLTWRIQTIRKLIDRDYILGQLSNDSYGMGLEHVKGVVCVPHRIVFDYLFIIEGKKVNKRFLQPWL